MHQACKLLGGSSTCCLWLDRAPHVKQILRGPWSVSHLSLGTYILASGLHGAFLTRLTRRTAQTRWYGFTAQLLSIITRDTGHEQTDVA